MQSVNIDTPEAKDKAFAFQQRRERNLVNTSLFTDAEQLMMDRVNLGLSLVVRGKIWPVSWGKRSANVTVKKGFEIADRKGLRLLEADWAKLGIQRKESAQGIIYFYSK